MKQKTNSLFCLLLAFIMLLTLVPAMNVFAEDTDTRTKVSVITATSNMDSIMKYGNMVTLPPTFNITAGSPAYFDRDSYYWEKKDGTEWKSISLSTLTEGTYRFSIQIRIDGDYGKTHVLDKGGVSVTVDGVRWEGGSNPRVKSTYSYDWVRSKEYVIEAPEDAPFEFIQVDSLKVGTSWVNTAITPIDLAKYATGGTKPYKFIKGSGPDWLMVSSDGTIYGTPTTAGKNDYLVFRVSDSANASEVIALAVEDTEIKPADRTKVSAIAATSNTGSIAVYGETAKIPTFSITEGSPAYFESGMCYWEKKNGTSWERYTGTFTEGTYRFIVQIRIDSKYGKTHVLDKDGVSVTVDGMKWADKDTPYVGETYSYVWVCSEEYAVTDGSSQYISITGASTVGNTMTINTEVKSNISQNGIGIIVIYDEKGKMLKHVSEDVHLNVGTVKENRTVNISGISEKKLIIKYFVWDKLSTLKPLLPFAEYTFIR